MANMAVSRIKREFKEVIKSEEVNFNISKETQLIFKTSKKLSFTANSHFHVIMQYIKKHIKNIINTTKIVYRDLICTIFFVQYQGHFSYFRKTKTHFSNQL